MPQFVYTMHQVGKIVPPKREILKDISLSFFPGAKIGVLGLNGSGKSTLLRMVSDITIPTKGEILINGKEHEFEENLTLIQALELTDIEVPRFCYHDKLSIAGNCRMCLVEVKGAPKPVASCHYS